MIFKNNRIRRSVLGEGARRGEERGRDVPCSAKRRNTLDMARTLTEVARLIQSTLQKHQKQETLKVKTGG